MVTTCASYTTMQLQVTLTVLHLPCMCDTLLLVMYSDAVLSSVPSLGRGVLAV